MHTDNAFISLPSTSIYGSFFSIFHVKRNRSDHPACGAYQVTSGRKKAGLAKPGLVFLNNDINQFPWHDNHLSRWFTFQESGNRLAGQGGSFSLLITDGDRNFNTIP